MESVVNVMDNNSSAITIVTNVHVKAAWVFTKEKHGDGSCCLAKRIGITPNEAMKCNKATIREVYE